MDEKENNIYKCDLQTLNEEEGPLSYDVIVLGKTGAKSKATSEIIVNNTGIKIDIISPLFGEIIKGEATVSAEVKDLNKNVESVELLVGDLIVPMNLENSKYVTKLDTSKLADGVYSLFIKAISNEDKAIYSFTDILIDNGTVKVQGVVKHNSTDFELNGKPYYYSGWNIYKFPFAEDMKLSIPEKSVSWTNSGEKVEIIMPKDTTFTYKQYLDISMMEAKKNGLDVVRTWGFNSDVNQTYSFYNKDESGVWEFNEDQFKRFDEIMDSASKFGVRVIVVFENYWDAYGGIQATTNYLGLDNKLKFYTDPSAKQLFKDYIANFVKRTNTVNGIKYETDPTLFAWELMNEPRIDYKHRGDNNYPDSYYNGELLKEWTKEMAGYVKSLDSSHMVSLGSEGHGQMVDGKPYVYDKEGYGNDPVGNVMSIDEIDFVTFHPYFNEDWLKYNIPHAKELIQQIVKESQKYKKPIVMEGWGQKKKFGLKDFKGVESGNIDEDSNWTKLRDAWNKIMLAEFRRAGGNGTMIWQFSTFGRIDQDFDVTTLMPAEQVVEDKNLVDILNKESQLLMNLNKVKYNDILLQQKGYAAEAEYYGWITSKDGNFKPEETIKVKDITYAMKKMNVNVPAIKAVNQNESITRAELAEMIFKDLKMIKVEKPTEKDERGIVIEDMRFNDLSKVTTNQVDAIQAMYTAGMFENTLQFRVEEKVTRIELAKLLTAIYDYIYYYGAEPDDGKEPVSNIENIENTTVDTEEKAEDVENTKVDTEEKTGSIEKSVSDTETETETETKLPKTGSIGYGDIILIGVILVGVGVVLFKRKELYK
ncbi:LPXTG cell wall anchor domain-containing protein [Clostridium grantii]|nr:LPXTG cell wall anchor domain-containing protein [Clostridium grantii]